MKVGDLVKYTFNKDFGIGIITMKRPFGGFIVYFPNSQIQDATKCIGLAQEELQAVKKCP